VSYGLQVLLESPIVLLLYGIELVSILLANLSLDFRREIRVLGNSLRLYKHILFEQILNLQVIFHFNELMNRKFTLLIFNKHEDGFLLHLDLANLLKRVVEDGELVFKIINLNFVHAFLGLDFNDK